MNRSPDDCLHRKPIAANRYCCEMAMKVAHVRQPELCCVAPETCAACCRSLAPPEELNPVVASVAYRAAAEVVDRGGLPECSAGQAKTLQTRLTNYLGVALSAAPETLFPPDKPARHRGDHPAISFDQRPRQARWMIGVTTAPRPAPTLAQTLASLEAAGFSSIQIFAEPGSPVPPPYRRRAHFHRRRLGSFGNLYASLATLFQNSGEAEYLAVFQDDIELAAGLQRWCDRELRKLDTGLISLFTPRVHAESRLGWRLLRPGWHRVFGAQALVFRRDVAERFLADARILHRLQLYGKNSDAVVSSWAARNDISIAYHTPSLVRHIGKTSSLRTGGYEPRVQADAVASTKELASWSPWLSQAGKVALIGWNTPTGLGYLNRDLASHLPVDFWLAPRHPRLKPAVPLSAGCAAKTLSRETSARQVCAALKGFDWILFAERPYISGLAFEARRQGLGVACVPLWEWLSPDLPWLKYVDLMICPTRHTEVLIRDWNHRYAFGWNVRHLAWPIDAAAFPFTLRRRCRRFLFVNGWGGARGLRTNGEPALCQRKGAELVLEAARLAPHLSFSMISQQTGLSRVPPNVKLRPPPLANRELYTEGDVCVQPSHWEGLGLPLLECQAAGLPLVTTDAPPMNEHNPLRAIPVCGDEIVSLCGQPFLSQHMRAEDLVEVLDELHESDLTEASLRARRFVETEHSWAPAVAKLRQWLAKI